VGLGKVAVAGEGGAGWRGRDFAGCQIRGVQHAHAQGHHLITVHLPCISLFLAFHSFKSNDQTDKRHTHTYKQGLAKMSGQ